MAFGDFNSRYILFSQVLLCLHGLLTRVVPMIDDVEKSPVSHTVLARSLQYLHSKKRRPHREHRCDAGLIPFESQVRTFNNSRVSELG